MGLSDLSVDLETAAKEAAGNHQKFESFAWHCEPKDSENWMLVYTHNRDSGLLDQSNAAAIEAILSELPEEDHEDFRSERHSHWGVGWVEGWAIRVYKEGKITKAFQTIHEIGMRLADYPVLDESDYSNREYQATLDNIKSVAEGFDLIDDLPSDYCEIVFSWFWNNNQSAVENTDDQGGYPSDDDMEECLRELGFLKEDEEDEEES